MMRQSSSLHQVQSGHGEDHHHHHCSCSVLHPVFYGCFDWHSSVHGHWLLARALDKFPGTELAQNISQVFDSQFTEEKISKEVEYFEKSNTFERTYGWAWMLKLQVHINYKIPKYSLFFYMF